MKNWVSSAAGEDKAALKEQVKTLQEKAEAESEKLDNAFSFAEKAWEESQEKLIMVSELRQTTGQRDLSAGSAAKLTTDTVKTCCLQSVTLR